MPYSFLVFIAEAGPECFSAKQDALQNCANSTMGKYFNNIPISAENATAVASSFVIDQEHCWDMDKLKHCVVHELEDCSESTPANLMEALFKFVRKQTPCIKYSEWKNPALMRGAASFVKASTGMLLFAWLATLVASF